MAKLNISKNLQNNVVVVGLIAILIIVLFGVSQVVLKNVRGDKANATVGSTYLAQIGISTADPNSNGGFDDSKRICQSVDGSCVDDGLIDYDFSSLVEKTNLTEAFDPNIANSTNGGLILTKNNNVFNQNGTITSKNYVPKAGKNVSISKIQIGIGLKPENLISLGYSLDSGANFTTAIGNYTYDQLKAQENQTIIEYNFPTPAPVSQGFAYKIALKADSSLKKSPSLKYVRVFYSVTSGSGSTTSTSGTTSSSGGSTTSTSTSGATSSTSTSGTTSSSSSGSTTSTSGTTSTSSTSGSTTSTSTSGSTSTSSTSTSSTSGSTTSSSSGGATTSTSTSGTPFLPLPSSSTSGTVPNK